MPTKPKTGDSAKNRKPKTGGLDTAALTAIVTAVVTAIQSIRGNQPAVTDPPKPRDRKWYAVCWSWDMMQFDPTTLRQEPNQQDTAEELHQQPDLWTFPWVYLPAQHYIRGVGRMDINQILDFLNRHCHTVYDKRELADVVRQVGGVALVTAEIDQQPVTKPPAATRHVTTARVRNTTRRSAKQHTVANLAAQREAAGAPPLSTGKSDIGKLAPVPLANPWVPGHRIRGKSADELREDAQLESYADQILAAIAAKPEDAQPTNYRLMGHAIEEAPAPVTAPAKPAAPVVVAPPHQRERWADILSRYCQTVDGKPALDYADAFLLLAEAEATEQQILALLGTEAQFQERVQREMTEHQEDLREQARAAKRKEIKDKARRTRKAVAEAGRRP